MQSHPDVAPRFRCVPLARMLAPASDAPAASNDNDQEPASAAMLEASLRHFAVHGLGAARAAREEAERAFFAGDRARYQWWLGICQVLDRRMARIAAREFGRREPEILA